MKLPKMIWQRVRQLRRKRTIPEMVLGLALRELEIRYRSQWAMRFGTKWYILDYYLPTFHVCLEADGISHRSARKQAYDRLRDKRLSDAGIDTVRIDNEVLHNVMQAMYLITSGIKKVKGWA